MTEIVEPIERETDEELVDEIKYRVNQLHESLRKAVDRHLETYIFVGDTRAAYLTEIKFSHASRTTRFK